MSGSAADRSRSGKRDEDEGNAVAAPAGWKQLSAAERATYTEAAAAPIPTVTADATDVATATAGVTNATAGTILGRPSFSEAESAGKRVETTGGVQPLAEQTRKQQRLSCLLDSLAVVELQLVTQWLGTKSKLKMARSSRRLMQAASHAFAWKGAPPFVVKARAPADVERIVPSLLRFAPVSLICIRMASLECVAALPHLHGLELRESPEQAAASLAQLLQHPSMAQLQSLRMDATTSGALATDAAASMRLITRLPQLRALGLWLPNEEAAGAALLQPLAAAPALTDLSLSWIGATISNTALLDPIARIGGLHRLSVNHLLHWSGATFRSFFCCPTISQLQHLELRMFLAIPSAAAAYEAAFSAMDQLLSLTLDHVYGLRGLLPHLRHAPSLCRLAIRCRPDDFGNDGFTTVPRGSALVALSATAPRLDITLLLPPTLDRWLAMGSSTADHAGRVQFVEQWNELHGMAVELERVAIVYDEPL